MTAGTPSNSTFEPTGSATTMSAGALSNSTFEPTGSATRMYAAMGTILTAAVLLLMFF